MAAQVRRGMSYAVESRSFCTYVLSLSQSDFQSLQKARPYRANRDKYGFSTLDEAVEFYGRPVRCPDCRSTHCVSIGSSPGGNKRFQCRDCGRKFSYLSGTVFFSAKRDFDFWERYITCMVFCPTEELASHMSGWLQRFLYKVMGMRMENLQSYLNWFVYLFQIKRDDEKYPKVERVIRSSSTDRCSICQKIMISYTHFRLLPD